MKRTQKIIWVLLLGFGIHATPAIGTGPLPPSMGQAASADAPLPDNRSQKKQSDAPAPGPAQPQQAPGKETAPGKKKTPYKEFVPSERIEPDHAVDFPADI